METVSLYGRVSTDSQSQNSTIENQKIELEKYVKANNLEVYNSYYDNGVSGTMPFEVRPQGAELLRDAEFKKFTKVLILKIDRFGRNMYDSLTAIKKLQSFGVVVQSITENTEDKLVLAILLALAEQERENILYRSKLGKNRSIDCGKWVGGPQPYGYLVDRDTKMLKKYEDKIILSKYSEADVLRKMYRICLEKRISCAGIADVLNSEGIMPTTIGKERMNRRIRAISWTGPRIRNLIAEPRHKGELIYGRKSKGVLNKNTIYIPEIAIVSPEDWNEAQKVLEYNGIKSYRNTRHDRCYLLAKKVVCSICDRLFGGYYSHEIKYYACNGHRTKTLKDSSRCRNESIRADKLEDTVWNDVKSFIEDPGQIRKFLQEKKSADLKPDYDKRLAEAKLKLLEIDKRGERLAEYLTYEDNPIVSNIKALFSKLKNEKNNLLEEIEVLNQLSRKKKDEVFKISEVEDMLKSLTDFINNPSQKNKQKIIDVLVDKVIVYPHMAGQEKREVKVYYSLSDKEGYYRKLALIE